MRDNCPISDVCQYYENGGKDRSHLERLTHPCNNFLDLSCQICLDIRVWLGDEIACSIEKMEKIRKGKRV